MPKDTVHIGLLSDTHGHWDDRIAHYLAGCDEIWHAGDVGDLSVLDAMHEFNANVRAVYGNIDDYRVRSETHHALHWKIQGIRFCMTHIGGRPGRYAKGIRSLLDANCPDVFICGHSHLLKVQKDPSFGGLYINPGAAGMHGFHNKRTLIKFSITQGQIVEMHVVELGDRARRSPNKE